MSELPDSASFVQAFCCGAPLGLKAGSLRLVVVEQTVMDLLVEQTLWC